MTVELDELYLILPVVGTAVALVLLWFISAKLRHKRQCSYMASVKKSRVPETVSSSQGQRRNHGGNNGGRGETVPQEIVTKKCRRTQEEFTFFWGPRTFLSQWYPCTFVVDGVEFNCAEHYMMYHKALLFGDSRMADRILASEIPKEQKALGRQVENFDEEIWNRNCKKIVKNGNLAKFGQNADLKEQLLATGTSTLVEASPFDRIWGIGLGSSNPKATDRRQWRGTNWLGEILTQVREELKEDRRT